MPHAKGRQKMKQLTLILFLIPCLIFAQVDIKNQIDSLKFVTEVPYAGEIMIDKENLSNSDTFVYNIGCGDRFLWDVVKLKEKAIPYLLELLDDTRETPASFPYQGGQCTVGKIAYIALQEIIHGIPTAKLLNVNPEDFDCGNCYYHITLDKRKNRKKFKKAVKQWYEQNKVNLVWINRPGFGTCDCSGKHPNGGHFELKK